MRGRVAASVGPHRMGHWPWGTTAPSSPRRCVPDPVSSDPKQLPSVLVHLPGEKWKFR